MHHAQPRHQISIGAIHDPATLAGVSDLFRALRGWLLILADTVVSRP
jgi:hypothetical protein